MEFVWFFMEFSWALRNYFRPLPRCLGGASDPVIGDHGKAGLSGDKLCLDQKGPKFVERTVPSGKLTVCH